MDTFRIINLVGAQIAVAIVRKTDKANLILTIPCNSFGYRHTDTELPFVSSEIDVFEVEEGDLEQRINQALLPEQVAAVVSDVLEYCMEEGAISPVNPGEKIPTAYGMSFTVH